MTSQTPRHGPTSPFPPQQPAPDTGHPGRRNQGFALGVALAAAVVAGLAIQGTYAAVALDRDTSEPTAATTTLEPASAPAPAAAKATDVQVAECDFAATVLAAARPVSADLTEVSECAPLNGDQRAAISAGLPDPGTPGAGVAGQPLAAPKGVVVSGDASDVLRVRSFKAKRDGLGEFAPVLRLENVGGPGEDFEYIGVKVTALRGEDVIATADGFVESIAGGQTITHEPISTDDFPRSAAGITYEVELGS